MTDEERAAVAQLPAETRAMVATALGPFAPHVEQRLAREVVSLAVFIHRLKQPLPRVGGWETS
jgi:hypothetical protein